MKRSQMVMRPCRLWTLLGLTIPLLLLYLDTVKAELQSLTDCVSSAAISIEDLTVYVVEKDGSVTEIAQEMSSKGVATGAYSSTKVAFGDGQRPATAVSSGLG